MQAKTSRGFKARLAELERLEAEREPARSPLAVAIDAAADAAWRPFFARFSDAERAEMAAELTSNEHGAAWARYRALVRAETIFVQSALAEGLIVVRPPRLSPWQPLAPAAGALPALQERSPAPVTEVLARVATGLARMLTRRSGLPAEVAHNAVHSPERLPALLARFAEEIEL